MKFEVGDLVKHPIWIDIKWIIESMFIYNGKMRAKLVASIGSDNKAYCSSYVENLMAHE